MKRSLILLIVLREVKEVLTDWRIVLPLSVLTFGAPILLGAGLFIAAHALSMEMTASLLPLLLLVCGFLPVGFSLSLASETFIGEQERNTIEALFATPLTDREIYLAKMLSALTVPLAATALALLTLLSSSRAAGLSLVVGPLQHWFLPVVIGLVVVHSVILVGTAVLISLHATSVRGANLLAAFSLIPLGTLINLEAYLLVAQRSGLLFTLSACLVALAGLLLAEGMSSCKRDLAWQRRMVD